MKTFFSIAVLVSIVGCAVGPNYERPALNAPTEFRGPTLTNTAATDSTNEVTFGDLAWWKAFKDPQLQSYIGEALTNNFDVQIAASRVLQAEANLRVTRSQFFPNVNAGGDLVTARNSEKGAVTIPPGVNPRREYGDLYLSMPAYEIDFWGRIRRATEASRAQLLATEDARRTVRQTIVSQIATSYLELLELDLELEISYRSYAARTNSLALTVARDEGGVAQMQDVYQARILVHTADAAITDIKRRLEQKENELSILLGRNPGSILRDKTLTQQSLAPEVPAGLPSTILERRPDIRFAEHQLIAANANIGEAKAAFYPRITLTGFYGYQTVALSDLFTGATKTWQFGPAVSFPLFTGGRLRGNLKFAEARFQESIAAYKQTVQGAFREVSDGLVGVQMTREYRVKQEERTQAHRDATSLANVRYEGGVTSYLEVLYNEQELFSAELGLAQARRDELLSVVQLYRALGGGWAEPAGLSMNTSN